MARAQKSYLIYKATSPSGRSYIGLTGQKLALRWSAHVTRARRSGKGNRHPLIAAILKYGADAFDLAVLEDGLSREEAMVAEQRWIAELGTRVPTGYNISEGGEADVAAGQAAFKELLKDPEWRATYLEKLRVACGDRRMPPNAWAAAIEWRKANPQTAWKMAYRASRIALQTNGRATPTDPRFGAWGRLWSDSRKVAAARRAYFARGIVADVWSRRTADEKETVGVKIGKSLSRYHAANPGRIRDTLAVTRSKIDRSVQGPAASAGLKKWWADLKKDPERYRAHFEAKRAKRAA